MIYIYILNLPKPNRASSVKYDWDPTALRKAALLTWKSLSRFACSHRFKHAKTFCFMNAEELFLVSIRSFGLELLEKEIPSIPDMYLLCPSSVVTEDGIIYKPLILFCQRNWPEEWNSQTSDDEDILRTNSDKYNFSKADEWYKFPIYDEELDDRWSNKYNAAKKRKCTKIIASDESSAVTFDSDDVVTIQDSLNLDISMMPSPISSSTDENSS